MALGSPAGIGLGGGIIGNSIGVGHGRGICLGHGGGLVLQSAPVHGGDYQEQPF